MVRVLVDCALHEVPWNPYYAHLAARLAAASKGHRVRRRGEPDGRAQCGASASASHTLGCCLRGALKWLVRPRPLSPGMAPACHTCHPLAPPRHQVTLQYTVWDHIKGVEAAPVTRLDNLAALAAALLAKGALPLAALKVVRLRS